MQYIYKEKSFDLNEIEFSYSSMKSLIESVAEFFEYKTKDFVETPDTIFGKIYHTLLLEPEKFEKKFFFMPEEPEFKRKSKTQPLTTDEQRQAWKEEVIKANKGKYPIKHEDLEKAKAMIQAFYKHPLAKSLLAAKENQYEKEYKFDFMELKFKSYIDLINPEQGYIVDLKTVDSCNVDNIEKKIRDYKYYIQEFLYCAAASINFRKPFIFHFIFQEKKEPYDIQIINLNDSWQDLSTEKIFDAIERWKSFKQQPEKAFIGRHPGITTLKCPVYLTKKFKNRDME